MIEIMRILIIANNALSETSNNGKTYRSFIQSMDRKNIAQFYTGTNEYPDEKCCLNFYRVTDFQQIKGILKFWRPVKNSHNDLMRKICEEGLGGLQCSNGVARLKKSAKNLSFVRDLIWSFNKWDNYEFNYWIKEFNPTHIFAVLGGGIALHRAVRRLSRRYKIPYSVYFTDDYVLNNNATNLIQKLYFRRTRRGYFKTLKSADKAFVIGERMKVAYEEFFSRNFRILVNGIHFDDKQKNKIIPLLQHEPVVISYIGGLHLNRWKTIVKFAELTKHLSEYVFDIRVFCVAPPSEEILEEFKRLNIRYCGCLTAEGVKEETRKSHIMLHVESFDETSRIYTKYSVSTKIPEYMSSMRGVIAFGPYEISSIQLFIDNHIGCVITDKNSDLEIVEIIRGYLDNYNSINFEKQYEFAKSNFNQEDMQLEKLL